MSRVDECAPQELQLQFPSRSSLEKVFSWASTAWHNHPKPLSSGGDEKDPTFASVLSVTCLLLTGKRSLLNVYAIKASCNFFFHALTNMLLIIGYKTKNPQEHKTEVYKCMGIQSSQYLCLALNTSCKNNDFDSWGLPSLISKTVHTHALGSLRKYKKRIKLYV